MRVKIPFNLVATQMCEFEVEVPDGSTPEEVRKHVLANPALLEKAWENDEVIASKVEEEVFIDADVIYEENPCIFGSSKEEDITLDKDDEELEDDEYISDEESEDDEDYDDEFNPYDMD